MEVRQNLAVSNLKFSTKPKSCPNMRHFFRQIEGCKLSKLGRIKSVEMCQKRVHIADSTMTMKSSIQSCIDDDDDDVTYSCDSVAR